ncbi:MAG: SH3 domain-containing protein [Myxococcales bacterium]|nr:SH3 domain-containing protein [Myxococcales bacterium]
MTLALALALALGQYTPAEAQALFVEANDAYYKADYAAAQAKYEKLLQAGLGGPDVLFNLGTTHLAKNELGPAVLYLERARRFSDDDDIGANLAVARQRQGDQIVGADTGRPFLERLADALDERVVSVAFLLTWWLAFVCWLVFRRKLEGRLLWGLFTLALFLGGLALGAGVGAHAYVRHRIVEGVVMPATARVREYPGDAARVSFEVHAGLKVRIMEESGRYARIRLPNALEGWTEKEGLVEL